MTAQPAGACRTWQGKQLQEARGLLVQSMYACQGGSCGVTAYQLFPGAAAAADSQQQACELMMVA